MGASKINWFFNTRSLDENNHQVDSLRFSEASADGSKAGDEEALSIRADMINRMSS